MGKGIPSKATQAIDKDGLGKVALTKREETLFGLASDDRPYVVLKYFQGDHQCFSHWEADHLKAFTDFIRKLSQVTWADIYRSGGSLGHKTGLGYTIHKDRKKLPNNGLVGVVSPDILFFELRITKEARVHGFRSKNAFFMVWLDRDHKIYPM